MADDSKKLIGNPSRLTAMTQDIISKRKRLPLEVMLDAMDKLYDSGQFTAAAGLAAQAAPYVHPKLKDIVISGGEDGTPLRFQTSLKGLSLEDLSALENLIKKLGGDGAGSEG